MKRLFYSLALVIGAFFLPAAAFANQVYKMNSGTIVYGQLGDSASTICGVLRYVLPSDNIRNCSFLGSNDILEYLYSDSVDPQSAYQGYLYLRNTSGNDDFTFYCVSNPNSQHCTPDPDPDPEPDPDPNPEPDPPTTGIPQSALDNYVGCEQWAQSQCMARNENFLNSYWSYANCTYSCIEHYEVTATAPASPSQLNSIFRNLASVDSGVRNVHHAVNTEIRRLSTNLANQVHGTNTRITGLSGDISSLEFKVNDLTSVNESQNSQLYDIGFTVDSNQANISGLHTRFSNFQHTLDNLSTGGGTGTSPDYTNLLNMQIGATYDVMSAVHTQTNNLLNPLNRIYSNITTTNLSLDDIRGELIGIGSAIDNGLMFYSEKSLDELVLIRESLENNSGGGDTDLQPVVDELADIKGILAGEFDVSGIDLDSFDGDGYGEGSAGRQSILDALGVTGGESWSDIETTIIDVDEFANDFDFALPSSGCPAPLVINFRGMGLEFSYHWICQIFEQLGVFVVLSGYFLTPFIVFGAKK